MNDDQGSVDGLAMPDEGDTEYVRLYRRFAALIHAGDSHFDCTPLTLVADAMTLGRITRDAAFHV